MAFYTYILTNSTCSVLYVGVTRELLARVKQHKEGRIPGFTQRYRVNRLVYYEEYASAYDAITREKQLKAGSRKRKMDLIDAFNPKWVDLYSAVEGEEERSSPRTSVTGEGRLGTDCCIRLEIASLRSQ